MPIISNQNDFFCEMHFVFLQDLILVKKDYVEDTLLTKDYLPEEKTLRRCLEMQIASDWYAEPEQNYDAMMLELDSPIPEGFKAIALRQFFWETKTQEQKENALPSLLGSLASRAHGLLRLKEQYRFCPTCGTRLQEDKVLVAKVCPKCKRLDFPKIEPAIIVLVTKGDEILLVKNKNRSQDFFSCVAGFVEQGETLEQCVEREVMEETNISIQNIRYVGSQPWPFPDQLMLAFKADYKAGEIKLQESELKDGNWFKKDSLPKIPNKGSIAYNLIMGYLK